MTKIFPLIIIVIIGLGVWLNKNEFNEHKTDSITLSEVLSHDDKQFTRAFQAQKFKFPRDHGAHPNYKTEWWYITGNVNTDDDKEFGYQITFFRIAMTPNKSVTDSKWSSNQFYMAHLALSDISQQKFYNQERFSRAALGLAGAKTNPKIRVWLEDWVISSVEKTLFPLTIEANDNEFSLSLSVESQKPIVLQGTEGLSQKGPESGNASYYYSYTRLATTGKVKIKDKEFIVKGDSWLDREWSTSALPKNVEGWDWFSIQLDNNVELMFYRLRSKTGNATSLSKGSLINSNGDKTTLTSDQVTISPQRWWTSEKSGVKYPINWRLRIPDYGISLQVDAAIANQELNHSIRYWEGAIKVTGNYQNKNITGKGYLELAGYEK